MKVYAPWRDPVLLTEFPGRREMAAYLQAQGIEAEVGKKKRYSTEANLAGLSHEAEDLESIETPATIVDPIMGVWPEKAPDKLEKVTFRIEKARVVAINGKPLDLTFLEYELLKFLATHPGKVFTRQTLLSRVWGYEYYGGARTVDVHVRRLRAKLDEEANLIQTVRSVGYRFGQSRWG